MKTTLKNLPAKKVVQYFEIYVRYLQDNNLADDSNSISVDSLINFVDDLDEDDKRTSDFFETV